MIETLILFIFPALMAYAAISDLLTMKISNRIVLLLSTAFLVLALIMQMPLPQFGVHALTGLAVLIMTFSFFAFGWIGGGDAKFAAAVAFWFGFPTVINYLVIASFLGGALTLVFLLLRRYPLPPGLMTVDWVTRLHDKTSGIPYGVALAGAGLLVYPHSEIFLHFAS